MTDSITDPPPADVVDEIAKLSASLGVVPPKTASNLVIGTWNVRDFDRVNPKWRTAKGDSPIRDLSNVLCLAEIIRRFDVAAIQEVRESAQAFLAMMTVLGTGWAYLLTDVTKGAQGNNERLAFVFDTARVKPSGLACELVVAAESAGVTANALQGQFARTPYGVSFARDGNVFTLVTLHVTYGTSAAARVPELKEIAQWLFDWANDAKDPWSPNLLTLGDFNIDRQNDPLYQAFTGTGLRPPDPLNHVPRTVFDDPNPNATPDHHHFYDQIAWFSDANGGQMLSFAYENAGMFNFANDIIPATDTTQLSWRISDHFPLWAEFKTGGG